MRRPGPHFGQHPGVRSGVFYFLVLTALLQAASYGLSRRGLAQGRNPAPEMDTLWQSRLDSLRQRFPAKKPWTPRPLDANRIDEYRGYLLGISHGALDRLYAFREQGGTLESPGHFGSISGLPDSTVRRLEPYLQFPSPKRRPPALANFPDLNLATARELEAVRGIGPVLSKRIVKFRDLLGGFLHTTQLFDVYGLDSAVALEVARAFPLREIPNTRKIGLNTATVEEFAALIYLNRSVAKAIVSRRNQLGPYRSFEELQHVPGFPREKIERIALYLRL